MTWPWNSHHIKNQYTARPPILQFWLVQAEFSQNVRNQKVTWRYNNFRLKKCNPTQKLTNTCLFFYKHNAYKHIQAQIWPGICGYLEKYLSLKTFEYTKWKLMPSYAILCYIWWGVGIGKLGNDCLKWSIFEPDFRFSLAYKKNMYFVLVLNINVLL